MEDEKVVPSTTEKDGNVASSPAKDVKEEKSSDSDKPWNKDPRFQEDNEAYKIGKSITALMKANNLEDVDDLQELLESGKKVHGKQLDLDNLDEIVKKAQTLDKYEDFWKKDAEAKKRQTEDPQQTIARLEERNEELAKKFSQKESSEKESKEMKTAVSYYEREVISNLSDLEMTKPEKEFIAYTLGVGNECNEIQITDKREVKRVVKDALNKYTNLAKTIKEEGVKEYLAGKTSIPKVASPGTVAATKIEPIKGLKNLHKAFAERMGHKE
jgi:phosphopantetheinyl transferase (holo-ACP synthase)